MKSKTQTIFNAAQAAIRDGRSAVAIKVDKEWIRYITSISVRGGMVGTIEVVHKDHVLAAERTVLFDEDDLRAVSFN